MNRVIKMYQGCEVLVRAVPVGIPEDSGNQSWKHSFVTAVLHGHIKQIKMIGNIFILRHCVFRRQAVNTN